MEDRVQVLVRFDPRLLGAIASACEGHVRALQRILTPMIHTILNQHYIRADAEASASGLGRKQLVLLFQERLRGAHRWDDARRELLAQLLAAQDDPGGAGFLEELTNAFYTRVHVLAAAHPELGVLFSNYNNNKNANAFVGGESDETSTLNVFHGTKQQPTYRVHASCSPMQFLQIVYMSAADFVYDDPFLFVQNVPSAQYIEHRQRCIAAIGRVIDRVLYDKTNAMVSRLWREIATQKQPLRYKGTPFLTKKNKDTLSVSTPSKKASMSSFSQSENKNKSKSKMDFSVDSQSTIAPDIANDDPDEKEKSIEKEEESSIASLSLPELPSLPLKKSKRMGSASTENSMLSNERRRVPLHLPRSTMTSQTQTQTLVEAHPAVPSKTPSESLTMSTAPHIKSGGTERNTEKDKTDSKNDEDEVIPRIELLPSLESSKSVQPK